MMIWFVNFIVKASKAWKNVYLILNVVMCILNFFVFVTQNKILEIKVIELLQMS